MFSDQHYTSVQRRTHLVSTRTTGIFKATATAMTTTTTGGGGGGGGDATAAVIAAKLLQVLLPRCC